MSPITNVPSFIAMACCMMGMFLVACQPFDPKHLPSLVLGAVLASTGAAYLAGYLAVAAIVAAVGIAFVAKHLWNQRIRNAKGDI
jgi:hypothetical protein